MNMMEKRTILFIIAFIIAMIATIISDWDDKRRH